MASKERSSSNRDLVYVILEVIVKKSYKLSPITKAVKTPGFKLDETFEPIPMSPDREKSIRIANDERGIIIRGVIKEDKIKELESEPNVIKAWKDTRLEPFSCPISPCDCTRFTPKGNMAQVATYLGVDQIWAKGDNGQGMVIGIVDGGINAIGRVQQSGEIAKINNVIGGFPVNDWGTTSDPGGMGHWNGHGNMTSTDALGMAPGAQLHDIRITGSWISNAIAGYDWAINQHKNNGTPHILSNSYGLYQNDGPNGYGTNANHPLTQKVVEAINEGIIVLFAAGNCGEGCPLDVCGSDTGPGKSIWGANGHHLVMTVGAANINGQFVGYSSQGPAALDPIKPDFCSITHFTGYFLSDNGTSAATPIAAGVVALLKQHSQSLTQYQIKQALMETATDIGPTGWDSHSGAGIINAIEAWNWLFEISSKPPKAFLDGVRPRPKKIKIADDGVKHIGDRIRFPGEVVINPAIRGIPRSANANTPFVLATPHHSMEWVRRSSIPYVESYEEIVSEYELAIAKLQEQLEYLQTEYYQLQEEYNKKLRGS
jgi:serine protease AprX